MKHANVYPMLLSLGEHHAAHGAQDVPGGHPAQDHRPRAKGEIHREGVHHQPHLLDPGQQTILEINFPVRTLVFQAGPLNLNPSFVFWNYNGKIITYDRERGGTVVISDRGDQTTSSLIISHATPVSRIQIQGCYSEFNVVF